MQVGWKEIAGGLYYADEVPGSGYGIVQNGWTTVYGIPCHFNENTYKLDELNAPEVLAEIANIVYEQKQGVPVEAYIAKAGEYAAKFAGVLAQLMQQQVQMGQAAADAQAVLANAQMTSPNMNVEAIKNGTWQLNAAGNMTYRPLGGVPVVGWAKIEDNGIARMYYFNGNGEMLEGWQAIGGKVYFFIKSGFKAYAATGVVNIGGLELYFDETTCELSQENSAEVLGQVSLLLGGGR